MADHTIQSQQNNMYRSRIHGAFKTEFSFLFEEEESSPNDAIHNIITDFSKNIEDIKKKIITTLQSGVNINCTDNEGKTPLARLFERTKCKKDELIKRARFLIERGADIENTDTEPQGQSEGKDQKKFIDKLKKLNLFGHPESITEKDIDSINESRKALEEKAKKILEEKANEESAIEKGATKESIIVKGTVKNIAMYGNCLQVQLQSNNNTWEFNTSKFLNSDFCKNNGISGFSTLNNDGVSGMHGAVHNKIRHYVVTDGSYKMALEWWVEGKKCEITINIDADGSVALTEGNDVTYEQLEAHKDVKLGDLFLADALREGRWKDRLQQQSEETIIKSVELQQGQSGETLISVGRGIEANNEKSRTHFGHNKGHAPQPPKVSSGSDQNEANNNVKTSTPHYNAPLPNFTASPIPFNKTSSNHEQKNPHIEQAPSHNLEILTDDHCEGTGKRYNDGSAAVIEDVHDEEGNDLRRTQTLVNDTAKTVAAQAQSNLLAITYPDGDKKSNTQSASLEDDKFASTITEPATSNSSPYFFPLPLMNSFKPSQNNQIKTPTQPLKRTIFFDESNSNPPQQFFRGSRPVLTNFYDISVHAQQQQKVQIDWRDQDQDYGLSALFEENPNEAQVAHENRQEVLPTNVEKNTKTSNSIESESLSSKLQSVSENDSDFSSPTHTTHATKVGNKSIVEESSGLEGRTSGVSLKPVDSKDLNPRNERRLSEDGLREEYSINANGRTEIFNSNNWPIHSSSVISTDSGFSSPTSGTNKSEIDPERLENIAKMLVGLKEPDYNDEELSTEKNASISDDQGSEYGEWDHSFDTNTPSHSEGEKEALEPQSKEFDKETFSKGFNQSRLNTGQNAYHQICFLGNNEQVNATPNQSLEKARNRLKKLGPNGKRSPQTEAHLIEAGLLPASENKQSISEINEKVFPVNNGTSKEYLGVIDNTYRTIYKRLAEDEAQLKVGVINEKKNTEQVIIETPHINANNKHPSYKEAKQFWEKRISQELQEKQEKQQRKHEKRGVLRL